MVKLFILKSKLGSIRWSEKKDKSVFVAVIFFFPSRVGCCFLPQWKEGTDSKIREARLI
jgi:hypothetical protein